LDPSHLHKAVGKNTSECRYYAADHEECGITLLQFISWVPCAKEIDTAREETGFQCAKDDSETHHSFPRWGKAEALKVLLVFRDEVSQNSIKISQS
jgi:hypothetical protein